MHRIWCNWQILWIVLASILQSSLYVSIYLCVIHLLHCTAPLRVIFWFLFGKRVKEKQLSRQKMKSLPACSSEWDLEAPSLLWSSVCQTRYESDFYIQNQNPLSWHSWCQSLADTVQEACFALKTEDFPWKCFCHFNDFIFNWMLGYRCPGNQHPFLETKTQNVVTFLPLYKLLCTNSTCQFPYPLSCGSLTPTA